MKTACPTLIENTSKRKNPGGCQRKNVKNVPSLCKIWQWPERIQLASKPLKAREYLVITDDFSPWCFDPSTAVKLAKQMLQTPRKRQWESKPFPIVRHRPAPSILQFQAGLSVTAGCRALCSD